MLKSIEKNKTKIEEVEQSTLGRTRFTLRWYRNDFVSKGPASDGLMISLLRFLAEPVKWLVNIELKASGGSSIQWIND